MSYLRLKRIIIYILIIISLFSIATNVYAKKLVCTYNNNSGLQIEYSSNKTTKVKLNKTPVYDTSNYEKTFLDNLGDVVQKVKGVHFGVSSDMDYNLTYDETLFKNNACPDAVYYCDNYVLQFSTPVRVRQKIQSFISDEYSKGVSRKIYIYPNESSYRSHSKLVSGFGRKGDIVDITDNEGWVDDAWDVAMSGISETVGRAVVNHVFYYNFENCSEFSSDSYKTYKSSCKKLESRRISVNEKIKKYDACQSEDCKSSLSTKIVTDFSGIKNICKDILTSYSYVKGQKDCLDICFNISKEISDLSDKYSFLGKSEFGDCNLSTTILSFIHNILKWMKYIAPVLVIILGILDFIKALASSDDDAMKKAQKRFIIRLVAAVLLFLLPLIIDYILRISNLVDPNCDITKVFK